MDGSWKVRMIAWFERRLPPCQDITRLISRELEAPLSLRERIQKRLHFLSCVWCLRYAQQVALMRSTSSQRALDIEGVDGVDAARLSDEAKERLKRLLKNRESD